MMCLYALKPRVRVPCAFVSGGLEYAQGSNGMIDTDQYNDLYTVALSCRHGCNYLTRWQVMMACYRISTQVHWFLSQVSGSMASENANPVLTIV